MATSESTSVLHMDEPPENKVCNCRMPWLSRGPCLPSLNAPAPSQHVSHQTTSGKTSASWALSGVGRAFVSRRRLRLDPDRKLHFLYEPGKQVSSAVKIKNASSNYVAFKFQTTAPKSCFMRPPGGVLSPNGSIIATVVKFVEQPERPQEKKPRDKFKIVSLSVGEGTEFSPEMFEERNDDVVVEQILRVVYIDPQSASPEEIDKLKRRLAEADAAKEALRKPQETQAPKQEGYVIDEWKERREKYLARQQGEGSAELP